MLAFFAFLLQFQLNCSQGKIHGTHLKDTNKNKKIVSVLRAVENAFVEKSITGVMKNISVRYYDDNGTPDGNDDYDYKTLKETILPTIFDKSGKLGLRFEIFDVHYTNQIATAEIRYYARGELNLPGGKNTALKKDFDLIKLIREKNEWKILSGL